MVDSNVRVECMVHQSSSRYGGIISAIDHVYILARLQMLERMKREISTFISGMDIPVILKKQMLGLIIYEKKSASRHMSSLRRNYLKAEKREIFLHIYS